MSPESFEGAADRLVTVISRWLARHVSDDELLRELEKVGPDELGSVEAEAVGELRDELTGSPRRAELEMVARETLEALALGA